MLHLPSFYAFFFEIRIIRKYILNICIYIYTDYKEIYTEASLGISFFHKENDIFPRKKKQLSAIFQKKTSSDPEYSFML